MPYIAAVVIVVAGLFAAVYLAVHGHVFLAFVALLVAGSVEVRQHSDRREEQETTT